MFQLVIPFGQHNSRERKGILWAGVIAPFWIPFFLFKCWWCKLIPKV